MSISRGVEFVLFWLMTLIGAATVVPCLVLPPWFEYKAAVEELESKQLLVTQLEAAMVKAQKQREHLENDPAYVLRLAQQEFGNIALGVETVMVGPGSREDPPVPWPAAPLSAAAVEGHVAPELSAYLERVWQRYPQAVLFARKDTRPLLLGLGTTLILGALLLLGRPRPMQSKPA
jgi:hypothetical protein